MNQTTGVLLVCALVAGATVAWLWPRGAANPAPLVGPDTTATTAGHSAVGSRPAAAPASRSILGEPSDVASARDGSGAGQGAAHATLHGTVTGTVTDADHRPVAGARVSVCGPGSGQQVDLDELGPGTRPPFGPEQTPTPSGPATTTNERGAYRLERVPLDGSCQLWVQPPGGWMPESRHLALAEPGARTLDIELTRVATVRCQVQDALSQAPIEGAVLRTEALAEPFARGDNAGQVELRVPFDGLCVLRVGAAGYAPIRHRLSVPEATDRPLVLRLARGARMVGRVVDATGAPVPGATVRLQPLALPAGRRADRERAARSAVPELATGSTFLGEPGAPSVVSAADGHFAFVGVVGDHGVFRGQLGVTRAGFCDTVSEPIDLDVPAPEAQVHVILFRGGTIEGCLRFQGKPVVGTVYATRRGVRAAHAESQADGQFRLGPIQPGVVTITANGWRRRSAGYYQITAPGMSRAVEVTVPEGERTGLDVQLEPEDEQRALGGCVRDQDRKPVPGVVIRCEREDRSETTGVNTMTQPDGQWRVKVPFDQGRAVYRVLAMSGGITHRHEHVQPPRLDLDFDGATNGRLQLVIACADGTQPAGIELLMRSPGDPAWVPARQEIQRPDPTEGLEAHVQLDLPTGAIDLRVAVRGHVPADRLGIPVTAVPSTLRVVVQRGHAVTLGLTGDAEAHEQREICLVPAELQLPDGLVPDESTAGPGVRRLQFEDGALRARTVAPGRYRVLSLDNDLAFDPEVIEVGEADVQSRVRVTLRK